MFGRVVKSLGIVWVERPTFQSLAEPHPNASTTFFEELFATGMELVFLFETLRCDVDKILLDSVNGFQDLDQVVVLVGQRRLDTIPKLSF